MKSVRNKRMGEGRFSERERETERQRNRDRDRGNTVLKMLTVCIASFMKPRLSSKTLSKIWVST